MIHFVGITTVVCGSFWGVEKKFKMAAVAMVSKLKKAFKYKNPPIWAKFGFQVDYDVAN
jgi:hypothetical protein